MKNADEILEALSEKVIEAGEFQMDYFRKMPCSATEKKDLRELVSFVDVETEKALHKSLNKIRKDFIRNKITIKV